jgi:hypothetical protein
MKEPNFTCTQCGKSGYKAPWELKRSEIYFCSRACSEKNKSDKKQYLSCLQCNETIYKKYQNQKFCSQECRLNHKPISLEVSCAQCCNSIFKTPKQIERSKYNFCSKDCYSNFYNKKKKVSCLYCKKSFIKAYDQIIKYPNHFCSQQCKSEHQNKKQEIFCSLCSKSLMMTPYRISSFDRHFCSHKCRSEYVLEQRVVVECSICGNELSKTKGQIRNKSRFCCSTECFKLLIKYYKNWGSSRSKLEIAIENHLSKLFEFKIKYNKKDIGYELDIHVPHINLGIEINGPLHYRVIFDEEKLIRTQQIDKEKSEECQKRNIKLVVINVSNDGRSKKIQTQRINEVVNIINNRIEELNHKPDLIELSK